MKKTEKHQQAYNLYFQSNLSQVQIAKLLDVDRKTVHNWLSEGKWRQQKKLAHHMPSKIVEQYYCMLANMNHEILSRSHQPYPLTHEGEAMRKIGVTIRHLKNRQTVNESMESYTYLAESISRKNPEFASQLREYIQEYIKERVDIRFADLVDEDSPRRRR
jgi:transposase-like protein